MTNRKERSGARKSTGQRRSHQAGRQNDAVRIFGLHAAAAALANPSRKIIRVHATRNAAQRLAELVPEVLPEIADCSPRDLDRMLGGESVHQGVLVEAAPLPDLALEDFAENARLLLFLDQITDPHNVGAILRSAAAFGVDALVLTARNSPPLEGVLAKAASGGLDYVPVICVPNLAQALAKAGDMGFTRVGLDSEADADLETVAAPPRLALILGAEDRGLRRLTREHCEVICALNSFGPIASLNVSNAAAISLHMMAHRMRGSL